MTDDYKYEGNELVLFSKATNWKKYVASQISSYIRGDVAEVGAGTGNFTPYLQNSGVKSWAFFEPDKDYSDLLRQKTAEGVLKYGKVINSKLADISDNQKFDTILYLDVLEHIKNDRNEVSIMLRHLNRNGYIIILSPAFQCLYTRFDKEIGHFRRYSKTSLKILFDDMNGIRLCQYLDSVGLFTSLANKWLLKQRYPRPAQIKIWDKYMVPFSKKTDLLLHPFFGRSILLVWQKK